MYYKWHIPHIYLDKIVCPRRHQQRLMQRCQKLGNSVLIDVLIIQPSGTKLDFRVISIFGQKTVGDWTE